MLLLELEWWQRVPFCLYSKKYGVLGISYSYLVNPVIIDLPDPGSPGLYMYIQPSRFSYFGCAKIGRMW